MPQVAVRYDPYTAPAFGRSDVLVHEQRVDQRSAPVVVAREGETLATDLVVFEGPVFDAQTELALELELREVDRYATWGISETAFGDGDQLAMFSGNVAIADGTFTIEGERARATLEVDVVTLY